MIEPRRQLPPLFQENEVLFGHDATPGLIAFEIDGDDKVKIFRRNGDATLLETAPFQPLMLLAGDDGLKGWQGETQIESLAGNGAFNRLALFPNLKQLDNAKAYLQKNTGKTQSASDAPYWYFSDPLHQFLLLSGKTHFLGMSFRDLKRLQLDIETYCQDGFSFPNASRVTDRITAIALSDSSGWERLISGKDTDEAEMLRELAKEIQRRDPDVIEGHNLFRFDLEYIEARAKRHKVTLNFGRDGSELGGHASRMQIAERTITYRRYEIFGRHIIDTWILAQHYDIAIRELESFGLKEIARHLGIASGESTYVPGDKTSWYFDHDPDTLSRYALDDVRETRSRGLELFQREWLEEMLLLLLKGEKEKIPELYQRYLDDIEKHCRDISWLMKTETLQDSLDNYQAKVKAKKRNAAAPYELALRADRPYQPGDQISYYVTSTKAKVKISENCKLASEWNPKNPDENVEHYKEKLKELYEKFRPLIEGDRARDDELTLGAAD